MELCETYGSKTIIVLELWTAPAERECMEYLLILPSYLTTRETEAE
jgi:hypothetical protein